MPRFAILTHDHPFWHWDVLLEKEAVLRAWRVLSSPDSDGPLTAEALPDHRTVYLDYEGPVSGNRGEVRQWDSGEYSLVAESESELIVELNGRRLCGKFRLSQTETGWTWQHLDDPQ